MGAFRWIAIAVLVFSIAIGATFGLLITTTSTANQKYSFETYIYRTSTPIQCYPNPSGWSIWLEIQVIGNRTGMNFQSVTLYNAGNNIRIDLPLNSTSYATYKQVNSTFESIYLGLPDYFSSGAVLQISLTFYISGFAPNSVNLPATPIVDGNVTC
ncbi:MAG TPA: hypothetical protein VFF30_04980 [Nitrososphaerales archaeon]|nr:hypothetical protein [Nitrososphaerales archaeon]